jgi:hypothetical protein
MIEELGNTLSAAQKNLQAALPRKSKDYSVSAISLHAGNLVSARGGMKSRLGCSTSSSFLGCGQIYV